MPLQSQNYSETGLPLSQFLRWGNQGSEQVACPRSQLHPSASSIHALCMSHVWGCGPPTQENNTGPLPRGSSRVVMPPSSFVCGTLLSTLATCKGFSDSWSCCFFMYFRQSSSVERRQGVECPQVPQAAAVLTQNPVFVPWAYLGSEPSPASGAMDGSTNYHPLSDSPKMGI